MSNDFYNNPLTNALSLYVAQNTTDYYENLYHIKSDAVYKNSYDSYENYASRDMDTDKTFQILLVYSTGQCIKQANPVS